jgi:hypothetical protein
VTNVDDDVGNVGAGAVGEESAVVNPLTGTDGDVDWVRLPESGAETGHGS